jgi:hypothetical protein
MIANRAEDRDLEDPKLRFKKWCPGGSPGQSPENSYGSPSGHRWAGRLPVAQAAPWKVDERLGLDLSPRAPRSEGVDLDVLIATLDFDDLGLTSD